MDAVRSARERFEVTLEEVMLDEGDMLVIAALLRGRGRESGAEVELRVFSAYWFERGKIRRRHAFTEREQALEAAGLPT
jgi:ketosteroid isomerase-like protein